MKFVDEGYIIGVRRHGESSAILTVLSREHGKICGYVKSGFSKKNLAVLQIGNLIKVDAWSRVDDNMLSLRIEMIKPYAVNFMSSATKLEGLNSFCSLCNICIPELQPVDRLYDFAADFINLVDEENWLTNYCFFPKSACAVSYSVGLAYQDKLFKFPYFIKENRRDPTLDEMRNLLQMTEFFLNKNFFAIHNLKFPNCRVNLGKNL